MTKRNRRTFSAEFKLNAAQLVLDQNYYTVVEAAKAMGVGKSTMDTWVRYFQANTVRNRNVLSTVRLGMEVLRRPDYEITIQHLLAAVDLAEQLLKDGYALADL